MKKLSYLLSLLVIMALWVASCTTEEEGVAPTITVTPTSAEASVGEEVQFTVSVSADAELKSITAVVDPYATFPDTLFDKGKHTASINYIYAVPSSAAAGTAHTITWTAEDVDGLTSTTTATINIIAGAGSINTYTTVLLGADQNANAGSFYATATNTVYTVSEAMTNQDNVDFIYYYGSTNGSTVAAPNDAGVAQFNVYSLANWTTKNATKFKATSVSTSDFDAMTDDATIVTEADGASETSATQLSSGNVFAFVTTAGKKGLVKVGAITTGRDGDITLTVKVQE
ncbi:MAG: hypothetical protein GXO79_02805 [Chlorobi bacterium]|nr:hypothetical protein [Chlorobiota bacterium]